MTPTEIRARVDALHPRTNPDGSINAAHVAAESTLRGQHGHPGWIADLDGPGRFIPDAEPCDHVRRSCEEIGCSGDGRRIDREEIAEVLREHGVDPLAVPAPDSSRADDNTLVDTLVERAALEQHPRHEVPCPSCGATIRARMADAPDVTTWQLEWNTPGPAIAAGFGPAVTVHPLRNCESDEDALDALRSMDPSGLRGVRVVRLDTTRTPLGEDGPDEPVQYDAAGLPLRP